MSKPQVTALLEERAALFAEMREMTNLAESEGKDFTAEQAEKFDKLEKEAEALETRARRLERLSDFSEINQRQVKDTSEAETSDVPDWAPDELRSAWKGAPSTLAEYRELRATALGERPHDADEYRVAFFRWLTTVDGRQLSGEEQRVLSKASAGAGGNLVPTSFARQLIDALRETGVMRQISNVISTDAGEALQVPSVSSHGTAAWTAENAAYTASDDAFALATLNAYKAATLIKVSEELLQDSAFDLEAYIRQEFGMRIGILENTAYVVGDGSGKPTGVTTQASVGVTAASATAITADELMDLYHSLLSPYRRNAVWVMKDSTIKIIRKLKTGVAGDNTYLWQPGLVAGAPDTLLGRPVYADPDMPAATAGLVAVLFGDFSYYWIRDVNGIAFQRLNELYAENGQVGFRALHRTDGKLLNTAAIKKITML